MFDVFDARCNREVHDFLELYLVRQRYTGRNSLLKQRSEMRDVHITSINIYVVCFMKTKLFLALPNCIQSVKLRKNVFFSNSALITSNLRLIAICFN